MWRSPSHDFLVAHSAARAAREGIVRAAGLAQKGGVPNPCRAPPDDAWPGHHTRLLPSPSHHQEGSGPSPRQARAALTVLGEGRVLNGRARRHGEHEQFPGGREAFVPGVALTGAPAPEGASARGAAEAPTGLSRRLFRQLEGACWRQSMLHSIHGAEDCGGGPRAPSGPPLPPSLTPRHGLLTRGTRTSSF